MKRIVRKMPTSNDGAPIVPPVAKEEEVNEAIPVEIKTETELPKQRIMTSRAMAEPQATVISQPPVIDGNEKIEQVTKAQATDEDFIRNATPEELKALRNLSEKDIFTEAIVAKDLKLPNFLDVKPKDPIWIFFWGNRRYDGPGGNRYEQLKALGFMNALRDDIEGEFSDRIKEQDGGIIYQDAILMKILKSRWYGYQKANLIRANRLHSRENIYKEGKKAGVEELQSQLNQAGLGNHPGARKVRIFDPNSEQPRPFYND